MQESVAAISVAGPTSRVSEDKIPTFAAALREAAQAISARIGFTQSDSSRKEHKEVTATPNLVRG
jgi:hypothetical protein